MSQEKVEEVTLIQPENAEKKSRLSWRSIGMLCAAFSFVVLILVGGYSGWYLMSANMRLATFVTQSQNQLQQLQSELSALKETSSSVQQLAQQSVEDVKNLKQTMTDFSKESQGNQEKWLLTEARYYTKLANDNLQFSRNIPLAIFLLKAADQEMSHVTDSKAAEIRKNLATDIANLQVAPQVDVPGLYMKLTALNNQLDQLPLQAMQSNLQEPKPVLADAPSESVWKRGFHETWRALKNIVVVRYNPNGSMPLVTPEQKAFLYQNIHAMLAQSTWALLHQQPDIYQSSLQQLTQWIKRYFVLDASATQGVLNEIAQLEKVDIHPPAPLVTNTLQAFNGV